MRSEFSNISCVIFLSLTIILLSCRKHERPVDVSSVLSSHSWYPYKTQLVTIDSMTVTLYDSNQLIQSRKTYITQLDTSILSDNCLLNAIFKFNANGSLHISNPCNAISQSMETTWTVIQNSFLSSLSIVNPAIQNYYLTHFYLQFAYFPVDSTYSLFHSRGNITEINNSQFVYNDNVASVLFDKSSWRTDTLFKISLKQFTTYRSKD